MTKPEAALEFTCKGCGRKYGMALVGKTGIFIFDAELLERALKMFSDLVDEAEGKRRLPECQLEPDHRCITDANDICITCGQTKVRP